jgi:outer membrane protein OmpA-like peptidoglycan-associated protein
VRLSAPRLVLARGPAPGLAPGLALGVALGLTLGLALALTPALAPGLAPAVQVAEPAPAGPARGGGVGVSGVAGVAGVRMEVAQVQAGASWSTVYWQLSNASSRPVRLAGSALRTGPASAAPVMAPAASASSGLRLVAPPGRTTYLPLTAEVPGAAAAGHCLCTHLADQELGPGVRLAGFTTFGRLPGDVTSVTVTAPRFGAFTGVPVVRGWLPGARADPSGFAVEGVDRLPYATVLRVRRGPIPASPQTPLAAGEMVLVDPATLTSYTALYRDDGGCLCAGFTDVYPEIGVYVFPPLPPAVRAVRAWYTGGLPVDDVAVGGAGVVPGGAPYVPWPAPRPGRREVTAHPRHDEATFAAVADRDGLRRDLRSGRATVFFDLDSATVRPPARTALRRLAAELSARPGLREIKVTGNTDAGGSEGDNLGLSARRARTVVDLLDRWITRPDVTFTIVARGERGGGEDHPSRARRALNRSAVISPT